MNSFKLKSIRQNFVNAARRPSSCFTNGKNTANACCCSDVAGARPTAYQIFFPFQRQAESVPGVAADEVVGRRHAPVTHLAGVHPIRNER
ncbi:MAG: hypothetical protein MOB07_14510 [Acidobacteria bacterium]|nr:hypothetical protein [Acidobacteriota bacterium]